MAFLATD